MSRITAVAAGVLAAASLAAAPAVATAAASARPSPVSTGHSGFAWGYPGPQGQRLRAVAFDGAVGYAVGDFGTVLRSADSGATWTGLAEGNTVSLNLVQEVTPSVVVVAGGCTVSESTDSGARFTALPLNLNQSGCNNPVSGISFSDPQHGYVELADGTILYTANGGRTLQGKTPAPTGDSEPTGIDFTSPTTGFAIDTSGDIERTTDGANSWAQVESSPQAVLAMTFVSPTIAFAVGDETLLETTDGGSTWSKQPLKLTSGGRPEDLTGIACSDAEHCLMTGDGDELVQTSDGGETGTLVKASSQTIDSVAYSTGSTVIGVGQDGTTIVSDDGGSTFPTVAPGQLSDFDPSSPFVLGGAPGTAFVGGNKGEIAATVDGGHSWSELRAPTGAAIFGVAFPTAKVGYVLGNDGGMLATTDGGTTWRTFPTTHNANAALLAPAARTVLLVGPKGVERSSNGGSTFSQEAGNVTYRGKQGPAIASLRVTAGVVTGSAVLVQGRSGLFVSSDRGASWTKLPSPPLHAGVASFSLMGARTLWVVGANGRVFSTHDAGKTWAELNAIGGIGRPSDIAFSSPRDGLIALGQMSPGVKDSSFGNVSLLSTTDGGATWQPEEVNGAQDGDVLASPHGDYLLDVTPNADDDDPAVGFFSTSDQGEDGAPSRLTITTSHRTLTAAALKAEGHAVTVTGRLSPETIVNQTVVLSYRIPGGRWSTTRATVATGGAFSVTVHGITGTTDFVAQSLGNGLDNGAGTPVLQLTVKR